MPSESQNPSQNIKQTNPGAIRGEDSPLTLLLLAGSAWASANSGVARFFSSSTGSFQQAMQRGPASRICQKERHQRIDIHIDILRGNQFRTAGCWDLGIDSEPGVSSTKWWTAGDRRVFTRRGITDSPAVRYQPGEF